MVPFNLQVLAKFGLCSNCWKKLDECMLAWACKFLQLLVCSGFGVSWYLASSTSSGLKLASDLLERPPTDSCEAT